MCDCPLTALARHPTLHQANDLFSELASEVHGTPDCIMKLLPSWIWGHLTALFVRGCWVGQLGTNPLSRGPYLGTCPCPSSWRPAGLNVFDRLLVRKKWFCFSSSFLLPLFPLFPNRLHLLWSLSLSSICYSALVCSQNVQPSSGHKSSQTYRTMSARNVDVGLLVVYVLSLPLYLALFLYAACIPFRGCMRKSEREENTAIAPFVKIGLRLKPLCSGALKKVK